MEKIIDECLQFWIAEELNTQPSFVEPEMADPKQDQRADWKTWYPIPSKVTDKDIEEFELRLGHKLPDSYKRFLKYKHFYELAIGECTFCEHPVNTWRKSLSNMIFDGYPREYLIDQGRIPFARWSDWGLLCFDTTVSVANHNYPIVLWDHESTDEYEKKHTDFETMMVELNQE